MLLQETLVVIFARAAPERIDLEERIAGLAIGVLGAKGQHIAARFTVEQEVNGVPLGWRKILHRQVVPLRTERSVWHWGHKIETVRNDL